VAVITLPEASAADPGPEPSSSEIDTWNSSGEDKKVTPSSMLVRVPLTLEIN
jgi:hypothetical protein